MNGIYLLIGTNLGDRLANLRKAEQLLMENRVKVLDESSVYETEPWGESDQAWFLNAVLQVETIKSPIDLLETCLSIEEKMGRVRKEKWKERIIDIDILYYADEILDEKELTIPHPGIPERKFTLIPLVELCPDERHPILELTQLELLSKCSDKLDCKLTELRL